MSSAEAAAPLFAALADPTRLALLRRLADGEPRPIVALAAGSALTRQAVSKHLAVLRGAGLVARRPSGREALYALRPERLAEARAWLDEVAAQWDDALGRLKAHVEEK
ncbi:MAG TPA: metalloregulator ArsR/SmtB family transcription factor [Allosphingosinicella sp.]|nr:metalloregulator ArsR/SmtB family transcription factor [Allosphingosinicella sp.]